MISLRSQRHLVVRYGWVVLLAGSFIRLANIHSQSLQLSAHNAVSPPIPFYGHVKWWIQSARCTQAKHVILALCREDGGFIPLELVNAADDRGHALLVDLAAWMQTRPFDIFELARLNMQLITFDLCVLCSVLLLLGMPWLAAVVLWIATPLALLNPLIGPDFQGTFAGTLCLVFAVLIWLSAERKPSARFVNLGISLLIGAFTIAINLFRLPFGLITVIIGISILIWRYKFMSLSGKAALRLTAIAGLLVASLFSTRLLLDVRATFFKIPRSNFISGHGFFHNTYLGLGVYPNPWRLDYDNDQSAYDAVLKIDPTVRYGEKKYFEIVQQLYWRCWREQPVEVIRQYLLKMADIFSYPLRIGGINIFLYWAAWVILLPWSLRFFKKESLYWRVACIAAYVDGFFILQSVITKPTGMFLYPAKLATELLLIATLFAIFQAWSHRFQSPNLESTM